MLTAHNQPAGGSAVRDEIELTKLAVDPENPRLESQTNSRDALRELFRTHTKKMIALITDIATRGRTSPLEKIGVTGPESDGRYRVKEGNRRVAALQALHTPELLKGAISENGMQRLRVLSKRFLSTKPSDVIECEILPADELREWIALRHTGEKEGAGLVQWGPTEQGRFLARAGGPQAIELQFLDRYIENARGDEKASHYAKRVPITTLKRLLESKPVRKKLGIEVGENGLAQSAYPEDQLQKWLSKVIEDLASRKVNARKLNTTEQMLDYVDTLGLPDSADALARPVPVQPADGAKAKPSARKASTRKTKPWSISDLGIRPAAHSRLDDILSELSKVSPFERYANIHAVMLRVFVELSTDDYLQRHRIVVSPEKGGNATLKARINKAADHLKAAGKLTNPQVTATNKMTSSVRFYSTQTLSEFLHNHQLYPPASDIIAMWKTFGPYLAGLQGT